MRAYWRDTIEAKVHAYLWMMAHFDPRSPEQIAVKACWAKIAKHAHALHAALDELEVIEPWPALYFSDIAIAFAAANPKTPHADYPVWKNQSAEAARLAAREAKGFKKSARGSNRSRGAAVDQLFAMLLAFWVDCGGRVGKGSNSPSTRFVVAAVGRFFPLPLPACGCRGAVVEFVRVGFRASNSAKPCI